MSLRRWRSLTLFSFCLTVLLSASAGAEPLLVRNGTLLTVTGGTLESTDLLIEDGRIAAIGPDLEAPAGARVIDATGRFVMPGIVDSHSHMGVYSWPGVAANSDGNEMTDPVSANMRAADAIWTEDPAFERARAGGVTTVQIIPGSGNLIGGQGATLKLRPAADLDRMRFAGAPRGIKMALGENPKGVYGERKQMPSTRMGNMALFRDAFNRTLNYRARWAAWNDKDKDERGAPPERDLELEVLSEVLDGAIRVHVHSYRKDGILQFLDIADEYGFAVASFQHCLEGYKIASELKKRDIAVATFAHWWGYKVEAWDGIPHNAALLARDGVKVSIHSDSGNLIQRLYTEAAVAARYGLSVDDALRAVTINAAAAIGVDDRIGSLEVGKDADLAIFTRHPLDVYTLVETTMIDGEVVYQRGRLATPADLPRPWLGNDRSAPPPAELLPEAAPENPDGLYAIVGGRVHTMTGSPIENGTVIVDNGEIKEVGAGLRPPRGATVIDAAGAWVFPGFVESHTALGLTEVTQVKQMRDEDEDTDPVLPHLRALDAYNTESALIPVARLHGITTAFTSPWEGNVFGGTGAIVRLDGDSPDAVTVRDRAALIVNFGEQPKARYGARKKIPSSRMGIAALVRETFTRARDYRAKWAAYENKEKKNTDKVKRPDRDLKMEALLPALAGDMPVFARAHRVDDILTAVRLADEFDLRLVLSHATEAYKVAGLLAERGIPVVVGPISTQPNRIETLGAIYENAARALNVRMLPYEAALAVAYGLPWEAAIRALTVNPAEIFGIADRIGTLQPGREASLFVAEGDPLQPLTRLRHLMIAGRPIPLTSHHTELYQKWH
jgi:imidazolonepropionase-like amidohydrolase